MLYTIFWLVMFLLLEKTSLSIGTLPFWGLVVAVLADLFYFGYRGWGAGWFKRQ